MLFPAASSGPNQFGTKGEQVKTVDNRFYEACHENKEPKERVYRTTRGDYIFGRVAQVQILFAICRADTTNYAMLHFDQKTTARFAVLNEGFEKGRFARASHLTVLMLYGLIQTLIKKEKGQTRKA